jgi:hypothetical protein
MELIIFGQRITLGFFTHKFLHIFEARKILIRKNSLDIFHKNI